MRDNDDGDDERKEGIIKCMNRKKQTERQTGFATIRYVFCSYSRYKLRQFIM